MSKGACFHCEDVALRNIELEKVIEGNIAVMDKMQERENKMIKLEQENARLREVLEFYADIDSWEQRDIGLRVIAAIDSVDHRLCTDKWGDIFWIGGKRAKKALERGE